MTKCPIVHAISARGIVFNQNNELLLVGTNDTDWHIPGGVLDDIEFSQQACKREVFEETGLEITVGNFAAISEAIYDARKKHNNFLKITNIYYHCTIQIDANLPTQWQDPDGNLIVNRKFFSEEEHSKIQKKHIFKDMSFKEIQSLAGKHLGYLNKTNLTKEQIFEVAYNSKNLL
jgi:8-oxo-dGTP pyrophosphatase MutT (NUDIX family)